jgi:hypothetical protein
MQLSKSDYMMYLKHPAWLWLKKHDKSKLPPIDANLQAMFDAGHDFEPFAESLFQDGIKIAFDNFDQYRTMPARTKTVLDTGTKVIFQGRVESGDLTCIFDVLERIDGDRFHLYEIKSSTKEKTDHIEDLAFQKFVLEQLGLMIDRVSVIVVNNEYVRNGPIDPGAMTKTIEVTDKVNSQLDATVGQIAKALEVMESKTMPDISPRFAAQHAVRDWLEIFLALKLDTDPYSIYQLSSFSGDLLGEFEDQGIERIADIPEAFEFENRKHQRYVELIKIGQPVVHHEQIHSFLQTLQFPLYFFDYETMSSIVPPFDGTRPYQQLPMQYSLHILREPDGKLEHKAFLHQDSMNPGLPLLKQLQQDIGEKGTVLVWHQEFEKGRNTELGVMFPEFAAAMEQLNDRIIDLKLPFSEQWYEDYRFLGSASIKRVLPVVVPELSYKSLAVQEGQSAQRLWMETFLAGKHQARKKQIVKDLLEYCQLDTLAMVKIYQFLRTQ